MDTVHMVSAQCLTRLASTSRCVLWLEVACASAAAEARQNARLTAIGLKAHSEQGVRAKLMRVKPSRPQK